jgi:hypothetical protein
MATHNCHSLLNICNNKDDLQQIQLTSTENYFYLLTNLQEVPGSNYATAVLRMAADKDQVKEPSTQLLKSAMNISSKRLRGKLYTNGVQKFSSNNSQKLLSNQCQKKSQCVKSNINN